MANPAKSLEEFRAKYPEFLDAARNVWNFDHNEMYTVEAFARALKDMYERGVRGDYPQVTPQEEEVPRKRVRPAAHVEVAPVRTRPTRTRTPEPEAPPPSPGVQRVRRTR